MKSFSELQSDLFAKTKDRKPEDRFRTGSRKSDPEPVIQFEIDGEKHTLDFRGKAPKKSADVEPSLIIKTDWETMEAMWNGRLNPWDALKTERLELEGSHLLGSALQQYFNVQ